MPKKSQASVLGIIAPKSTLEKNICLFLKRNNNEATVFEICQKMDEREVIIKQVLVIMQKSGLLNFIENKAYLNIRIDG